MKKTISIILAIFASAVLVFGQDARQRTVSTIVSDVLALMPIQTADELQSEITSLAAAAPQSVELLASQLQAPEKGVNNKIEYAINALANFACAPGNEKYKDAVKQGFKKAAEAAADPVAKAFLETQIRLLSPEDEPKPEVENATAKELLARAKALAKSNNRNDLCESMYLYDKVLGKDNLKNILKALKSDNRSYRVTALNYAEKYADEAFIGKLASKYNKLSDGAKVDVLNWLGDNKVKAATDLFISQFANGGEIADAAIEAAGKTGGRKAARALIDILGTDKDAAAMKALKSFPKSLTREVEIALDHADGQKLESLLSLASGKRMKNCADKIFALAGSNESALKALAGVVSSDDFGKIAGLLDKASDAQVPAYASALQAALSKMVPEAKYATVLNAIESANNKERFFPALASSNTDQAVEYLANAYNDGNQAALKALTKVQNLKALKPLLKAANDGDETSYYSYITLCNGLIGDPDEKCAKIASALANAKKPELVIPTLNILAGIPTAQAFQLASNYLDDKATAITAAGAVKNIASKCVDVLDAAKTKEALGKAFDIYQKRGEADDEYACKELKKMIDAIQEPSPIYELTADEQKQGFELLFDGTNLDKWVGNKEGYRISNNCIYVTAGYGNGGNLYTEKKYKDFVFRFEFAFARPGANNGVGVRTPMGVDAAYDGMCEVQILDHDDPIYEGLNAYQVHGSVYGVIPAKRIVHKPLGEWSCEEIRVQGNHVTVTVNGEVILDGDVKEACQGHNVAPDGSNVNPYTVDHRNHPGMFNETGHVGFLGHGAGVEIRNVRILDLNAKTAKKGRK